MSGAPPPADHLMAPAAAPAERAWHLLTVLVRLGRPASAAELASRCVLAPSTDLVELLCRIPGSPLHLTDDGFVTLSDAAMAAFLEFLSTAVAPFVPRLDVRVSAMRRACGDVSVMYVRKRKLRPLTDDLVVDVPRAKRSLLLPNGRDLEEIGGDKGVLDRLSIVNHNENATKEALQIDLMVPGIPNNDILSVGSSTQGNPISIYPFPMEIDSIEDNPKNFCNKIKAMGMHEVLSDFQSYKHNCCNIEINANVPKEIMPKEMTVSEPDVDPALQNYMMDKPARVENETQTLTERGSQMTAQLATRIKVDLSDTKSLAVKYYDDGTIISHVLGPLEDAEATAAPYSQSGSASVGVNPSGKSLEEFALAEQADGKLEPSSLCLSANIGAVHNQQRNFSMKPITTATPSSGAGLHSYVSPIDHQRDGCSLKNSICNKDRKLMVKKQNTNSICNNNIVTKDNTEDPVDRAPKGHLETKLQPNIESFIIEEEEGSGGYGTVYRARRKKDDKIFAVKCPHANAHSHHVNNEMKMLERFGGRNFVIKYEGSFNSGNSECFVLEHVEHDRPEILKKEINVFELQWYGYCMFRALASLHKQGIVHRDVKPGNFLFSRKLNKGYLIDFNLANDLRQKLLKNGKNETDFNTKLEPVPLPNIKSTSLKQAKKVMKDGLLDNGSKEAANDSKKHPSKNLRKRSERSPLDALPKFDSRNRCGSQAADVSGVTSAKDPTSTRTPVDKLKQPIPCKGRKELINFLHEAMQTPNQKGATVPASQRKRIAAPLGKVDRRLVILTPMPLHYGGIAVAGAGMFNDKRNGKHKREGPCVGTKGFRAPEVLFKSIHQGCKVDIWSAGVTLLYLMIGKTPFGGDPEQNIKDIAKLRGSEDLWEVAKLHNCESSFPQELFDVLSLRSVELREWCLLNTKRPEFIEAIPLSLFGLVDKCLTVNPRCRITAEEALMHDFFSPCHESLRKQRKLRREIALESGTSL